MKEQLTTIKQCSDLAEAAFLASYLEEHGIPVTNSAEKMGAWTGRYSLLARGPVLRVHPRDAVKARKLLATPPPTITEDFEETYEEKGEEWKPGDQLKRCPLCGSPNISAIASWDIMGLLLKTLTFGAYTPTGDILWICRDCDWDSKRK
ncbi:MAG TPA: hypothetical protein ENN29_12150 [Candidatus Hydrogenedentes bacterium]|nr:hypothetical protein [Candidatus Hydrogenedentota bacterium]